MNTGCKQAKKTQAYNKVFTSVVAQHKVIPKVGRWQARLLEFSQVKQNHMCPDLEVVSVALKN